MRCGGRSAEARETEANGEKVSIDIDLPAAANVNSAADDNKGGT